jgi:hypothetical protein
VLPAARLGRRRAGADDVIRVVLRAHVLARRGRAVRACPLRSRALRPVLHPFLCLGLVVLATAGCDDRPNASPAAGTVSAAELLSGSQPPDTGFHGVAGFALTQNTIQLNAQLGSASPAARFVLDSGAPMTIAPALAASLSLAPLAETELAGPESGHLGVPVTRIPELQVAGVAFRDVGAVVDWVEPPNELACLSLDGLMGASLLQTAIWQIDFKTKQITVTDSLSELPGIEGAMRIPFERGDAAGSPRIEVGVGDAEHVSLLVDLGFNGSVAMPQALYEQTGNAIASDAPAEDGRASSTVFGQAASVIRIGRLRELRLGTLRLPDFPVVTGAAVSDFHVGIDFLRHFRVTLDWKNDTLHLERRDPERALYDDFATYGFKPQLKEGALEIGALWRGSAADRAGLKLGDRLARIDGRTTETPDFATLCEILDAIGLFGWKVAPVEVTVHRDDGLETVKVAREPLLAERGEAARP